MVERHVHWLRQVGGRSQRTGLTRIPLKHLPVGISVSVCLALVLETGSKEAGNRNEAVETVAIGRIYTLSNSPRFFLILHFPELATEPQVFANPLKQPKPTLVPSPQLSEMEAGPMGLIILITNP